MNSTRNFRLFGGKAAGLMAAAAALFSPSTMKAQVGVSGYPAPAVVYSLPRAPVADYTPVHYNWPVYGVTDDYSPTSYNGVGRFGYLPPSYGYSAYEREGYGNGSGFSHGRRGWRH